MNEDKENVFEVGTKMKKYVFALGACMVIFAVLAVVVSDKGKTEIQQTTLSIPTTKAQQVEVQIQDEPDTRENITVIIPATEHIITEPATEENTTKGPPKSYSLPMGTEISNDYSRGVPVYNDVLDDWRTHNGIDFSGAYGDSVRCIADGIVKEIREDALMGSMIVVEHGGGVESTYCGVIASETIAEGIFVPENGNLGSLGYIPSESTDQYPHLHLEIRVNGTVTDPLEVMGRD